MVVLPTDAGETVPVTDPMVATDVFEELQVPPPVALVSVVVPEGQSVRFPAIAAGVAPILTVELR